MQDNSEENVKKKTSKKKILLYVVGGLVVLGIIGSLLDDSNDESSSSSTSSSLKSEDSPRVEKAVVEDLRPQAQIQFTEIFKTYKKSFRDAENELKQARLRSQRKQEFANALGGLSATSWRGKIKTLDTNSEGKAILKVTIPDGNYSSDIEIGTWNNALSDIMDNTLIDGDSPLYDILIDLSKKQEVEFSGVFFSAEADYIKASNLTIHGAMTSPDFLFKFESVKPIN
jgi:hypothetical protein